MRKKNVLLVNWGTETAFYPLSESHKLQRYNIFLASTAKIPLNIKSLFSDDHIITTNPYDPQRLCEDVSSFCNKKNLKFDIVTTFFEMNVYQTAVLADFLEVKRYLPPAIALQTSVNKYLMRLCVEKAGLRQPNFFLFEKHNLVKAYEFYRKLASSAIIKPVHSGHSYGTRFLNKGLSYKQFETLFEEAVADLYKSYDEWMDFENQSIQRNFLMEEYIDGLVISCDGGVGKVGEIKFIGTAEFEMTQPPIMQQIGHTVPIASLNNGQVRKCKQYVRRIVNTLGLQYCGFHCELKWFKGKPYLLEVSGRLPGGGLLPSQQAVSKYNIFDVFFAVFEDDNSLPKKNSLRKKAETQKNIYIKDRVGKYQNIDLFLEQVDPKIDITVSHYPKKGEIFYLSEKIRKTWVTSVTMRTQHYSASRLRKIMDQFISSIVIETDTSMFTKLEVRVRLLKRRIVERLRFLY